MQFLILPSIILLFSLTTSVSYSQDRKRIVSERVIIKSNLFNLLAKRPALSIEKAFNTSMSSEISFVQGKFNSVLFTDKYKYNGFLIRIKKHFNEMETSSLNPYLGIYAGNLKRDIQREGYIDKSGFVGYSAKDFATNSIRSGASGGLSYITRNYFIFDMQTSLGYGRYFNVKRSNDKANAKGYLDAQLWFSLGYCF